MKKTKQSAFNRARCFAALSMLNSAASTLSCFDDSEEVLVHPDKRCLTILAEMQIGEEVEPVESDSESELNLETVREVEDEDYTQDFLKIKVS